MITSWKVALVLLVAAHGGAAWAQSSSGTSGSSGTTDVFAPGPADVLRIQEVRGQSEIVLAWTEPYDDFIPASGIASGASPVSTRALYYRTDHPIVTAADFSGLVPLPGMPGIGSGGSPRDYTFSVPQLGITYHFALRIVDDATLVTISNPVSQAVPLSGDAPDSRASSAPDSGCSASPTGRRISDSFFVLLKTTLDGAPILVLGAVLTAIAVALRRPS